MRLDEEKGLSAASRPLDRIGEKSRKPTGEASGFRAEIPARRKKSGPRRAITVYFMRMYVTRLRKGSRWPSRQVRHFGPSAQWNWSSRAAASAGRFPGATFRSRSYRSPQPAPLDSPRHGGLSPAALGNTSAERFHWRSRKISREVRSLAHPCKNPKRCGVHSAIAVIPMPRAPSQRQRQSRARVRRPASVPAPQRASVRDTE